MCPDRRQPEGSVLDLDTSPLGQILVLILWLSLLDLGGEAMWTHPFSLRLELEMASFSGTLVLLGLSRVGALRRCFQGYHIGCMWQAKRKRGNHTKGSKKAKRRDTASVPILHPSHPSHSSSHSHCKIQLPGCEAPMWSFPKVSASPQHLFLFFTYLELCLA